MTVPSHMQLAIDPITTTCAEADILDELLDMDNRKILELGCGTADMTRAIAGGGTNRQVIATEVDHVQLERHRQADNPPNITFIEAGAEQLPLDDTSVDMVLMFKSLHHVPVELMDKAFGEIHRVLRPCGLVYISEPIYAGNFNDILRLFHDEQAVRLAAFNATQAAVNRGDFTLVTQRFFNTVMDFDSFDDFAGRIIQATHTDHQLDDALFAEVKRKFEHTVAADGELVLPIRVDLLKKAGGG